MASASVPARVAAALLAVLGPLAVLGATWQWLQGYEDVEERQALSRAGHVVNARVTRLGVRQVVEQRLAVNEPEVLLLGPSYANTDADPDALAAELGLVRDKVLLLSIPNSVGAHWYAILKHRVFGRGHRPRLVVVISGLQSMLLTTPLSESSSMNLAVHLDGPDPVIEAKQNTSTHLALARLREKRGHLRNRLFDFARLIGPLLLLPSPNRPRAGMRAFETREALDRVFDDAKVDMSLHAAGTPVVELDREERTYDPSMLPSPEASFLPEITALVREHGARMVWVRPPMSPDIPPDLDDIVVDGTQEAAIRAVHARGGSYLDMRALPMSSDMYRNEDHMNEEGSRRFTQALAVALKELDALEPDRAADTLPPLSIEALPGPPMPPLPAAEAGWPGEGSWIAPGASLRFRLGPWEALRGPLQVRAVAEQLVGPPRPGPVLTVADATIAFEARDAVARWHQWVADAVPATPPGSFEVAVSVPADGSWVRLTGLAVGDGGARVFVVGDAGALDGVRARLFGRFRFDDGVLIDETLHPTYPKKPGRVPLGDRAFTDAPGRLARYETHRWDFLSDEYLIGATHFGSRCSPLRVTEDGAELPHPNVPCVDVHRHGNGRTCHTPEAIYFAASDDSDPTTNGRTYRMVLDAGRRCDGAVWLYPKDQFRIAWPADQLARFRRGADTFTLGARYLQKRKAQVAVTLTVDGVVRIDEEVNGVDLKRGPRQWLLDPPLPPDASDVVLELRNLDFTFYLIQEAALSEGAP